MNLYVCTFAMFLVQLKAVYMNINHDCLVKKEPVIKG